MCSNVKIRENWCHTIGELKKITGLNNNNLPIDKMYYNIDNFGDNTCLCPVDIKKLAELLNLELESDDMDYFLKNKE